MTSLVGQESVWNECINQFDTPSHIFITGAAGCGKTILIRELLIMEFIVQIIEFSFYSWMVFNFNIK